MTHLATFKQTASPPQPQSAQVFGAVRKAGREARASGRQRLQEQTRLQELPSAGLQRPPRGKARVRRASAAGDKGGGAVTLHRAQSSPTSSPPPSSLSPEGAAHGNEGSLWQLYPLSKTSKLQPSAAAARLRGCTGGRVSIAAAPPNAAHGGDTAWHGMARHGGNPFSCSSPLPRSPAFVQIPRSCRWEPGPAAVTRLV